MPRDINGNYSLPSGNPVVTGTPVSSSWANATLSDIQAALTDSLSRSGDGGMLAAFENLSGSITLPGITWAAEPSSGFYRAAAGDFRYAIAGVDIFTLAAEATGAVRFRTGAGTLALPAISWTAETGTGWYRAAAGDIRFAIGGVDILRVTATGLTFVGPMSLTSTDATAVVGPDLVLDRNSASPAVSDNLGRVVFQGRNSSAAGKTYAAIGGFLVDPVAGTEDGLVNIQAMIAGTLTDILIVGNGIYSAGVTGGAKGVSTLNVGSIYQSNAQVATLSGVEGLTNKTLTSPVINTAVTGTAIATQAQLETGTAVDVLVTPGRQQYHQSAVKAWALIGIGGGVPAIAAQYNVASLTDNGVGDISYNWTTSFSSVNYGIQSTGGINVNGGFAVISSRTAAAARIVYIDASNLAVDVAIASIMATGDQ